MQRPRSALLPDGRRLHLQHGPIDLVVEAFGPTDEVQTAYRRATSRFDDVLEQLVEELPGLRSPLGAAYPLFRGPVARRMAVAVWPHRADYVTPMAAVAGAVADEVLAAMAGDGDLRRAYVNNGGDIALYLADGERFDAGIVADIGRPEIGALARIEAVQDVRGIATSGWRGRSHSLGIADAVTVLAGSAAAADVAATLIANAVNVDNPAIQRTPAWELDPDSDLGELPVTVDVGDLPDGAVDAALLGGVNRARAMLAEGLIAAAHLGLRDRTATIGDLPARRLGNGAR